MDVGTATSLTICISEQTNTAARTPPGENASTGVNGVV
jgi:hypothetical protein